MGQRKSVNYINNKQLYAEMVKFIDARTEAKTAGEQMPQISNYIGQAIMLIASRLATKPNFSGYSFKDEMISDGIENCIMYLHNFNPAKSTNPFAYITLIIWRAYIRRIEKEAKHSYIRHKMMFASPATTGLNEMDASDAAAISSVMSSMSNDKSADIIEKFETKLANKKEKKANAEALALAERTNEDGAG